MYGNLRIDFTKYSSRKKDFLIRQFLQDVSEIVNDTGNPRVKKSDPYPYPFKPVPVTKGTGIPVMDMTDPAIVVYNQSTYLLNY
jgi:hypothetical protein